MSNHAPTGNHTSAPSRPPASSVSRETQAPEPHPEDKPFNLFPQTRARRVLDEVQAADAELDSFLTKTHAQFVALCERRREAIREACRSGHSQARVGAAINVSRQRVGQILSEQLEARASDKDLKRAWTTAAARDRRRAR